MNRAATALFCLAFAGAAQARYDLVAGYPWTYSETGTETANALAVDFQGFLVVAGNVTPVAPPTGVDVLLRVFSLSHTGQPIGGTNYDSGYGLDEGPPALKLNKRQIGFWVPAVSDVYVAFTAQTPAGPALGLIYCNDYFLNTASLFQDAGGGYPVTAAPSVDVLRSGTPYVAGTVTANAVDQMAVMRIPYLSTSTPPFDKIHHITATYWTGSATLTVTGRAVAAEGDGGCWVVGQSGGDVVLFHYTADVYEDPTPQDLKALISPGYPRTVATPAWDEPEAAVLDGLGYLWVAGSIDQDGAIWRFDPAGALVAGFPVRINAGSPSRLWAIAVTGDRHAVATGSAGGNLLLAGVDEAGTLLPSLPLTDGPPPLGGTVEGRGLALDGDGSAWIAGTWRYGAGQSAIRLWRYAFTPDPPPIAPGQVVVRGPEGGFLNLARGETVSILARPRDTGELRVQILSPRGELVRQFVVAGQGDAMSTVIWDGRNAAGEWVASGLYGVRVTGGGLTEVRRVVVIRKR